ncbi:MAG: PKD domain-containing protein, partial [Phycisphaeraceae bacterium JB051]
TVTDDDAGQSSETLQVTVAKVAPVVDAVDDQHVDECDTITFTGMITDAGSADTFFISWDFCDVNTMTGNTTPDQIYTDNGIYTVTFTDTDDDGGQSSDTLQVTVSNIAPVIDSVSDDQTVFINATTHFSATASDAAGENDPLTYTWDFGDGSNMVSGVDQSAVQHTYSSFGTYTITLTVSDDDGGFETQTRTVEVLPAQVTGRYQFFNDNVYDGNGQSVDEADIYAVTSSITALLPGEQGSRDNYSTYINGINGVVVEVSYLHDPQQVTVDDFEFKVGNNNQTDQWEDAPTPTLTRLQKQTEQDPDRFFLSWDNQAVLNSWLSIRMLANSNTFLEHDDVFYFGNQAGDADGDGQVGIADVFAIWNNRISSNAPRTDVDNRFDINKDGWVNITDVFAAWNSRTNATGQWLNIIQPSAQQVQTVQSIAPQQSENQLALALASMQGKYNLSVIQTDSPKYHLNEVFIADYLQ